MKESKRGLRGRWLAVVALAASAIPALWAMRPAPVKQMPVKAGDVWEVPGEIVVDVRDSASASDINALERAYSAFFLGFDTDANPGRILTVKTTPSLAAGLLARLRKDPNVERAEPQRLFKAFWTPNDPRFKEQWNFQRIHMEKAWDISQGKGAVVAVIDTGVAFEKDDKCYWARDFKDTKFTHPYDFVNRDKHPNDDHGHGTHVAGTIAESTDNGEGVAGIAFKATIMPIKVLTASGSGKMSDIAAAIRYAADKGAHVINMSLGGPFPDSITRSACQYAYKKGVTIVCAAGNSGQEGVGYPAAYPECVAVSALGPTGKLSYYSSWGKQVAISAPGGDKQHGEDKGILQNTVIRSSGRESGDSRTDIFGRSLPLEGIGYETGGAWKIRRPEGDSTGSDSGKTANDASSDAMFADVPLGHWAYEAMEQLRTAKIVVGYPDGYFTGKRVLTRYEFAVALDRAIQELLGTPTLAGPGVMAAHDNSPRDRQPKVDVADTGRLIRLTNELQAELRSLGVSRERAANAIARLSTLNTPNEVWQGGDENIWLGPPSLPDLTNGVRPERIAAGEGRSLEVQNGDDYYHFQGTSMASPHVAGVAALIVSQGVKDPGEVKAILQKTAQKRGAKEKYGAGELDAYAAAKTAGSAAQVYWERLALLGGIWAAGIGLGLIRRRGSGPSPIAAALALTVGMYMPDTITYLAGFDSAWNLLGHSVLIPAYVLVWEAESLKERRFLAVMALALTAHLGWDLVRGTAPAMEAALPWLWTNVIVGFGAFLTGLRKA